MSKVTTVSGTLTIGANGDLTDIRGIDPTKTYHQIDIENGTLSGAGTLGTFKAIAPGRTTNQPLFESDGTTALTRLFDVATNSIILEKMVLTGIDITISAYAAGPGAATYKVTSWSE